MGKHEIVERAARNGRKAAEYDFDHDYRTAKTYSDSTKGLMRSYPMFKEDIWKAHQDAYTQFRLTHKR